MAVSKRCDGPLPSLFRSDRVPAQTLHQVMVGLALPGGGAYFSCLCDRMKFCSRRKLCRLCGSRKLTGLGTLAVFPAHAGEGPDPEGTIPSWPVEWSLCEACHHLQNTQIIQPEHLYRTSPYRSRAIPGRAAYLNRTAEIITGLPAFPKAGKVIEVGANDGQLLELLGTRERQVIGVDPSPVLPQLPEAAKPLWLDDVFEAKAAASIRRQHGMVDAIVAIGTFSRIDNLHAFLAATRYVLKEGGVFVFDIPNLASLVAHNRLDWVSHEILSFPTIGILQQFFDQNLMRLVQVLPEAGTPDNLLCVARRKEAGTEAETSVQAAIQQEQQRQGKELQSITEWVTRLPTQGERARAFLAAAREKHGTLGGIGLDHGSWNVLHVLGITPALVDVLFDDNPAIQAGGPGSGLAWPVHRLGDLAKHKPGAVVLLNQDLKLDPALNAYREKGGKVIVLFPEPAYAGK